MTDLEEAKRHIRNLLQWAPRPAESRGPRAHDCEAAREFLTRIDGEGRAGEGGELTPAQTEAERTLFESKNPGDFDFTRNDAGQYSDLETYLVFSGWLARIEQSRPRTVREDALEEAARLSHMLWFEMLQMNLKSEGGAADGYRAEGSCDAAAKITKAIRALKDQTDRSGG